MTETQKLRTLLDEYGAYAAARDWGRSPETMLALINGQSVLALEEQLADYRRTVTGTDVVQCKICGGAGRKAIIDHDGPKACDGCHGSGLVRV